VDIFSRRKFLVTAIFLVVGAIFVLRLFALQVLSSKYKESATNNVLREIVQYPARGLVYDRNGVLLVFNKPAYDLLDTQNQVESFDTKH